ncbi:MAG TPA: DEAD/DEAH box helicase, partial [Pirellulales bacterium]
MALSYLPIDDVLGELVAAVRARKTAVLHAPTGAGKTTRLPGALLNAGLAGDRKVIVLEPRRIAARAAARRIAEERGSRLGGEVGWQVRFERVCGRDTRILFVTKGVFVRMLQDDPFLDSVGAVVFDEFHERSLDADLALAMTRRVREEVRPDLAIVAASATLDVEPIARYLGDAPIVRSAGRTFPVDVHYWPAGDGRPTLDRVSSGIAQALESSPGDV